ncbi:MAG TPA: ATP-binding protein, partial [Dehalococcoidia bacterium]
MRRRVPLGHPDFGRVFPCDCVLNEQEEERVARLRRYSNLGALARLTFQNLSSRGHSQDARDQEQYARAVRDARQYAEAPEGWLVLTGPSGSGKTHVAAAIANRCIERGTPALFMNVPDLLDHLRSAYGPQSDLPYDVLFEQVRSAPLLILDDLGAQSGTPWAQEKLYQLINGRYEAQLPTVFTTAVPMEDLEDRLRTRLSDPGLSRVWALPGAAPGGTGADPLDLPLLRSMTFQGFDLRRDLPAQERVTVEMAFKLAQAFAEAPDGWLVLQGVPGCGKTHLAAAIGNRRRERGEPVMFQVVPDLLDHLRSAFDPDSPQTYDDLFEQVREAPLLILDDLGAHSSTPWAE